MTTASTRSGEFILSEGNGHISRETITIASGQGKLYPGQVLGEVTASGKYAVYASGATDGTEVASAILYGAVDATDADATAVAVVRLAEVKEDVLTGLDADARTDLATQTVLVR